MSQWADEPVAKIQRRTARTWGPMAWNAWVAVGFMRYEGEYGTYAWSRRSAERKARRLLRKYHRSRPGSPEVVDS